MENFGKFVVASLVITLCLFTDAFVFMKLWGWLIVPIFSLPLLSIVEALGISFFFAHIKLKYIKHEEFDNGKFIDNLKSVLLLIVAGWVLLLFGWVIHLWY